MTTYPSSRKAVLIASSSPKGMTLSRHGMIFSCVPLPLPAMVIFGNVTYSWSAVLGLRFYVPMGREPYQPRVSHPYPFHLLCRAHGSSRRYTQTKFINKIPSHHISAFSLLNCMALQKLGRHPHASRSATSSMHPGGRVGLALSARLFHQPDDIYYLLLSGNRRQPNFFCLCCRRADQGVLVHVYGESLPM